MVRSKPAATGHGWAEGSAIQRNPGVPLDMGWVERGAEQPRRRRSLGGDDGYASHGREVMDTIDPWCG